MLKTILLLESCFYLNANLERNRYVSKSYFSENVVLHLEDDHIVVYHPRIGQVPFLKSDDEEIFDLVVLLLLEEIESPGQKVVSKATLDWVVREGDKIDQEKKEKN